MKLIINLPNREETLAIVRAGWERAARDPYFRSIEGRFESNAFGEVIMSPPPPFAHNDRSYRIAREIERRLGGHAMTECPILTIDGVKLADAAWFTTQRYETVRNQAAVEVAPEICVEVISPSNTAAEMRHKRSLYFETGALECWTHNTDGTMSYYLAPNFDKPHPHSELCPNFEATSF